MKLLQKTYLNHLVVWISYFLLLFWFYNETSRFEPGFLKSLFITLVQAGVFYLNLYYLLPRYFEDKHYRTYGLYILAILIISMTLVHLFDQITFRMEMSNQLKDANWQNMANEPGRSAPPPPPRGGIFDLKDFHWKHILFNGFFIVVVLFLSTIYYNISLTLKKEKEALQLKSRIMEAESNMLKSQINPHFLFNTLNNIYSMAQLKSDQTPDAVHRLSELLRYVIYDCNQEYVKLEQEINYLKSYIALNLMKDENLDNVKYNFDDCNDQLLIAPMILIPFVENSFKHSNFENKGKTWISINLNTTGSRMQFNVSNTIPETATSKDKTKGIGMENVTKRLQLIYPDKHFLNQSSDNGIYKVELMIELNEN